jgi:type I restriction enzyme S subunit
MSSLSALPSHWITKSILELQNEGILLVEDGNHGNDRPRKDEFTDNRDGICFIRAADIKDGAIKFDECSRINNTAFDRIRKGKSNPGDILITHKGTVGTLAFVPPSSSEKFVCSPQTTFYRVTDVETIDREFLYTFMRSHYFLDQFNMYAGETDMAPYVSLTNQRKLKISFPPLDEQKKIKHLISLLDKKISFLKQANKTIEQIAQTIFRSWFVDFDPVHAKKLAIDTGLSKDEAERAAMAIICGVCEPKEFFQSFEEIDKRLSDKLEKMSAEDRTKLSQIASLFPSEFEDSELGEIPKSWSVEKLGEHIEILDSKRVPLSKQEREKRKGKIPYYGATSVMGYVDEHIFDEELVLIGEDGSVMDKNGYPFMQYIWGEIMGK